VYNKQNSQLIKLENFLEVEDLKADLTPIILNKELHI